MVVRRLVNSVTLYDCYEVFFLAASGPVRMAANSRAQERGELDLDRIPPAVPLMPFDLLRHDVLMTLRPAPPERIRSIVDDLFLPLVGLAPPPRLVQPPVQDGDQLHDPLQVLLGPLERRRPHQRPHPLPGDRLGPGELA
jgi:hypothetical protein